ncbi:MAG: hypothetical protein H6625_10670 [Bdellovibrionaceae bacterium]|nr:hypothetical protein [Pseudobdellovibrionaceae bacterium]
MLGNSFREELKAKAQAFGVSNLSESTGLSRQALYDLFEGGDMKLSNLEKVLGALGMELSFNVSQPTAEDVLGNLTRYGAPLVMDTPKVPMSLVETLVSSLKLVKKESRLTSVLPYFLLKKYRSLNEKELLGNLKKNPEDLQLFGYFLEVALYFRKRKGLQKLLLKVEKLLDSKSFLVLREGDQTKSLKNFERFDNPAAKKWKIGTRDELNYLVERCKKWEELEKAS